MVSDLRWDAQVQNWHKTKTMSTLSKTKSIRDVSTSEIPANCVLERRLGASRSLWARWNAVIGCSVWLWLQIWQNPYTSQHSGNSIRRKWPCYGSCVTHWPLLIVSGSLCLACLTFQQPSTVWTTHCYCCVSIVTLAWSTPFWLGSRPSLPAELSRYCLTVICLQSCRRGLSLDQLLFVMYTADLSRVVMVFYCTSTLTTVKSIFHQLSMTHQFLSLIHIWRCRRIERCRSRWSPYH